MPRIVSVWFPAWPIERLRRHTPACVPGNTPFALVEAGGHGLTITAANTIAMQQVVAVGATLADVRAALPNLMTAPAEQTARQLLRRALAGEFTRPVTAR